MTRRSLRRGVAGFTLIEVLMVLVLFSIGLIGLVGLQARTTQMTVDSEDSARAVLLANDLAATMWGAGTVNLAAASVDAWKAAVADPTGRGLPNGSGSVAVAAGVATITVNWRAPHESADAQHRYVTQVVIP